MSVVINIINLFNKTDKTKNETSYPTNINVKNRPTSRQDCVFCYILLI